MIMGDGKGKTVITGGKNVMQNLTTFHTASFGKSPLTVPFLFPTVFLPIFLPLYFYQTNWQRFCILKQL